MHCFCGVVLVCVVCGVLFSARRTKKIEFKFEEEMRSAEDEAPAELMDNDDASPADRFVRPPGVREDFFDEDCTLPSFIKLS